RALTVKETYFCRERPAFRALRELVLPSVIRERESTDRTVRCWSAACATGEEAYSAAMLLWSVLPVPESWQVRIAATDVDPAALATAERGRYSAWSFRNVSPRVIDRFFLREPGGTLSVVPALRQWVTFSRQNLVTGTAPAPEDGEGYDLVICRNVLIYFTPDAIGTVIDRLAGALREGGWLVVGITEAPFVRDPALVPVRAPGITLFRKQENAEPLPPPASIVATPRRRSPVRRHPEPARPTSGGHRRRPDRRPALRPCADVPSVAEAPGLAHRHADRGDLSAALEAVDAALAADPLDSRHLYLRAMVLNEQDRLDDAMEAMRRVVYADPASILALYWLGVWALGAGRPREARRALREARALCASLPPGALVPDGEGLGADRLMTMIDSVLTDSRENA
ncbi:MAG: CheR family methyltransferase, partial [Methanospirillum sp.]